MHIRAIQHFHYGHLLSTPKENKQNYLHGKAPNKQKKNEKSFGVFFLITTTTGMESKLTKSYNYFFVFLKVLQTHKKKTRKWK